MDALENEDAKEPVAGPGLPGMHIRNHVGYYLAGTMTLLEFGDWISNKAEEVEETETEDYEASELVGMIKLLGAELTGGYRTEEELRERLIKYCFISRLATGGTSSSGIRCRTVGAGSKLKVLCLGDRAGPHWGPDQGEAMDNESHKGVEADPQEEHNHCCACTLYYASVACPKCYVRVTQELGAAIDRIKNKTEPDKPRPTTFVQPTIFIHKEDLEDIRTGLAPKDLRRHFYVESELRSEFGDSPYEYVVPFILEVAPTSTSPVRPGGCRSSQDP